MELTSGIQIHNRYTLKESKGRGSFGEVWRAHDDLVDEEIALKIYISLDPNGIKEFKDEYFTTRGLSHPNLLTTTDLDMWENRPFLKMKYCGKGSCAAKVGKMTERELWQFIHDTAAGLAYLHDKNIVHQDIKPDNILIDDENNYLITDFGISKQLRATMRKQSGRNATAGAVAYMGPERFEADPTAIKASDIWSLGVSIYELAKGELPFCGMGGVMLKNGAELPKLGSEFTAELNQTMQACLTQNTWDRPTAAQLEKYARQVLIAGDNGEYMPEVPWKKEKAIETPQPFDSQFGTDTVSKSAEKPIVENPIVSGNIGDKKKLILWGMLIIVVAIVIYASIPSSSSNSHTSSSSTQSSVSHSSNTSASPVVYGNTSAPKTNGHQYVDLGLSSGTLWATCNIGASTPYDYGNYYAWGEIRTKSDYSYSTYNHGSGERNLNKYCTNSDYGCYDGKRQLDFFDDVAHAQWGGKWRIPTYTEMSELVNNCNITFTSYNGVCGYNVVSRRNGNSIFLPCAGYRDGNALYYQGDQASYWTSTLNTDNPYAAWRFFFDSNKRELGQGGRIYGRSIRPVCSPR